MVSPETAALCALYGEFIDPLSQKEEDFPQLEMPEKFDIDDSMIIKAGDANLGIEIFRGPNIGEPPKNTALSDILQGKVVIKVGDKITTDHIMPAGARLKFRSNVKKYSEFVFEEVDFKFSENASRIRDEGKAVFIVAGESYGQGSSREHAALCPMFLGVKAVFAKSFERIHSANLVNFGILPLVFKDSSGYEKIDKNDLIEIIGIITCLDKDEDIVILNKTKNIEIKMKYNLSQRQKDILKAGGLLNFTKSNK